MVEPSIHQGISVSNRAKRAQKIIYLLMAIFIALPFVVAWLTGNLSFN